MAQRGKDVEKALKKIMVEKRKNRNEVVAETIPKIARSFLEMWKYLDTFKDSKIPMEYNMIDNIFGSFDKKQVEEVFNAVGGQK